MKKRKGFFIFESLIAMIILAVGIFGVIKIQMDSISAATDAQYRTVASYMAESIIGNVIIDQPNINNYVNGSSDNYVKWLEVLSENLPAVSSNPPTLSVSTVNGINLLTVNIYWKNPGTNLVSQYTTQAMIF